MSSVPSALNVASRSANRWLIYLPWFFYLLMFLLIPRFFDSGYSMSIINQMGTGIIFALSYNMLLGQGGMLSFGHAVYMGLGGYVTIHVINAIGSGAFPLPVPLVPLIGGLGGLFFGLLFGSFSTRRTGTIFAMISLGVAELIAASSHILRSFFGGEEGIDTDRMVGPEVFGLTMAQDTDVYIVVAFWAFISTVLMYLITQTPLGRMSNAVRDNPDRVQFLGYSPQKIRYIVFALSGFFAGIAGGLSAINYEIFTAESVSSHASGTVLLMAYVGGVGHFIGPILGAIVITLLSTGLSSVTEAWQFYLGLIFVLMVLFAPFGIAGMIVQHQPIWRAGLMKRLMPGYCKALLPFAMLIIGAVVLIEINFHLSLKAYEGPEMSIMGIGFNASNPIVWVLATVLLVVGAYLVRRVSVDIADTWGLLLEEIKKAGIR